MNEFNFFDEFNKKSSFKFDLKSIKFSWKYLILIFIILLFVVSLFFNAYYSSKLKKYIVANNKLKITEKNLQESISQTNNNNTNNNNQGTSGYTAAELHYAIDIADLINKSSHIKSDMLSDIRNNIPDGMFLNDINIKDTIITISGYCTSNQLLAQYLYNLESSNNIKNAIPISMTNDLGNYNFTINAEVKEPDNEN